MKILLSCFFTLLFVQIFGQDTIPPSDTLTIPPINPNDGSQVLIDGLSAIWLAAIGVLFPLFTFIASKWKWAQDNLNVKLISSIVALIIAGVAIFGKGIPPLAVSGVLGIVYFVINIITGSTGKSITDKNVIMEAGKNALRM